MDPVFPGGRRRVRGHQRQKPGRHRRRPGRHRKRAGRPAGPAPGPGHERGQDPGHALRHPQRGQIHLYQHLCGVGAGQSRRPPRRHQGQAVGLHRSVRPAGYARRFVEKVRLQDHRLQPGLHRLDQGRHPGCGRAGHEPAGRGAPQLSRAGGQPLQAGRRSPGPASLRADGGHRPQAGAAGPGRRGEHRAVRHHAGGRVPGLQVALERPPRREDPELPEGEDEA